MIQLNLAPVNTSTAVTMVTIGNTATPIANMTPAGSRPASNLTPIVPLQQQHIQVNIFFGNIFPYLMNILVLHSPVIRIKISLLLYNYTSTTIQLYNYTTIQLYNYTTIQLWYILV
jgi:hypothetical protein